MPSTPPLTVSQAINNILIIRDYYAKQPLATAYAQTTADYKKKKIEFATAITNAEAAFCNKRSSKTDASIPSVDQLSKADKKKLALQTKSDRKALKELEKDKLSPQKFTMMYHKRLQVLNELALTTINRSRDINTTGKSLEDDLVDAIKKIDESWFSKNNKVKGALEKILHGLNENNAYLLPSIRSRDNLKLGLQGDENIQYANMHIVNRAQEILAKYGKTMYGRHHFWNMKVTRSEKVTAHQNIMGKFEEIFSEVNGKKGMVGYDVVPTLLTIINIHKPNSMRPGKLSQQLTELEAFLNKITRLENMPSREQLNISPVVTALLTGVPVSNNPLLNLTQVVALAVRAAAAVGGPTAAVQAAHAANEAAKESTDILFSNNPLCDPKQVIITTIRNAAAVGGSEAAVYAAHIANETAAEIVRAAEAAQKPPVAAPVAAGVGDGTDPAVYSSLQLNDDDMDPGIMTGAPTSNL